METLGNCGRGNREYGDSLNPSVLNGVLAGGEPKVYPEDRCEQCEAEGVLESEDCFHRHWGIPGTGERLTELAPKEAP